MILVRDPNEKVNDSTAMETEKKNTDITRPEVVTHEAQYQDKADDGSNFPLTKTS